MKPVVRAQLRDAAWSAYVWPKGNLGNALQGAVLQSIEGRRVRRVWHGANRAVLVHTPGKVGSQAIVAAVRPALGPDDAVFHTHRINPNTLGEAWGERRGLAPRRTWYTAEFLGEAVQAPGSTSVVVLSAVRDPVRRNLSAFFQNVERYRPDGRPLMSPDLGQADELADLFVTRFPHTQIVDWVDSELEDVFGVDVYGSAFDHERGYQVVRGDRATVAIARHDRLDDALPGMTEHVLGQRSSRPPRVNDSDTKAYGPLYKAVREQVRLEPGIINMLYNSRFVRHFFTDEERQRALAAHRRSGPS